MPKDKERVEYQLCFA